MKVTYNTYHSFKDKDGKKRTMTSQLYQVGIYVIFDNDSTLQGSLTPQKIRKFQNKLRKDEKAGLISELCFGPEITVSDDSGFWKEIVNPKEIFVRKGKTYECQRPGTGKIYHFTITGMTVSNEREECLVTFTSTPKCDELPQLKISDNCFSANIFSFQRSINPVPIQL